MVDLDRRSPARRDGSGRGQPRIAAVAISNQRETFALFRRDGSAIRPGTVWLDERVPSAAGKFWPALRGRTPARDFGQAARHHSLPVPHDLARRTRAGAVPRRGDDRRRACATSPSSLTGDWVTSTASADPMGILDMRAHDVVVRDPRSSRHRPCPAAAPRPARASVMRRGDGRGRGGAPACVPERRVVAGGGDGQCAGTGVDLLKPGDAYVNLGTAVVSGSYGKDYACDPAFRTEVAIADRGYIFETCLRAGTFLIDWFVREFYPDVGADRRSLFEALERDAARAPIGAGGLLLVPYWQGCMNPHWDSHARGLIAGTLGIDQAQRHLPGGARGNRPRTGGRDRSGRGRRRASPIDRYTAVGGGAASDLWAQILADSSQSRRRAHDDGRGLVAGGRYGGCRRCRLVRLDRRGGGRDGGPNRLEASSRIPARCRALRRTQGHLRRSLAPADSLEPTAHRPSRSAAWLSGTNWNALIEDVVAGRWVDPEDWDCRSGCRSRRFGSTRPSMAGRPTSSRRSGRDAALPSCPTSTPWR